MAPKMTFGGARVDYPGENTSRDYFLGVYLVEDSCYVYKEFTIFEFWGWERERLREKMMRYLSVCNQALSPETKRGTFPNLTKKRRIQLERTRKLASQYLEGLKEKLER